MSFSFVKYKTQVEDGDTVIVYMVSLLVFIYNI